MQWQEQGRADQERELSYSKFWYFNGWLHPKAGQLFLALFLAENADFDKTCFPIQKYCNQFFFSQAYQEQEMKHLDP